MDQFFVKVKIYDKIKFIEVTNDKFNREDFIKSVLSAFEISADMDAKIILSDGDDALIEECHFVSILKQFKNCNHFAIKCNIIANSSESQAVRDLKNYLYDNKCAPLFIEFETKEKLGADSLQYLSDRLFQYITDKYSIENRKNVEDVVDAVVSLFPNTNKVCIKIIITDFISIRITY